MTPARIYGSVGRISSTTGMRSRLWGRILRLSPSNHLIYLLSLFKQTMDELCCWQNLLVTNVILQTILRGFLSIGRSASAMVDAPFVDAQAEEWAWAVAEGATETDWKFVSQVGTDQRRSLGCTQAVLKWMADMDCLTFSLFNDLTDLAVDTTRW